MLALIKDEAFMNEVNEGSPVYIGSDLLSNAYSGWVLREYSLHLIIEPDTVPEGKYVVTSEVKNIGGNWVRVLEFADIVLSTPEELREQMAPLPARKFWKAAGLIGVTEDGLASAFANPEDQAYIADDAARNDAVIDLRKTVEFERLYPLLVQASAAAGIPADQLDALWAWTHSQP